MLQEAARWHQGPVPFVASWTTLARGARPPGRSGAMGDPSNLRGLRGGLTNHNRGRTASPAAAGRRLPRAVCSQRPAGHDRRSDRAPGGRHSGYGTWGRSGQPPAPRGNTALRNRTWALLWYQSSRSKMPGASHPRQDQRGCCCIGV